MFNKIVLILALLVVVMAGCDTGQQMIKPVAQDILTDDPAITDTTEQEIPTIDFNPEVVKPTLPERVELLPDDIIYHVDRFIPTSVRLNDKGEPDIEGRRHNYEPLIFDDAVSALKDARVLNFFKWWEINIEHGCKIPSGPTNTGALHVNFTYPNRDEMNKFAEQFDGNALWNLHKYVLVLDEETTYFHVELGANFAAIDELCE